MSFFSKLYTVNPQTTLSCIVCSLRNNKIVPSRGNGKNLIFCIIQLKLWWWYFSGFISDYAYEKLHNNFHCLHQKPPQLMRVKKFSITGNKNYLKWQQLLVSLDQYLHLKIIFGIKCSSNLFLKKVIKTCLKSCHCLTCHKETEAWVRK